jgi:hypothetical protein
MGLYTQEISDNVEADRRLGCSSFDVDLEFRTPVVLDVLNQSGR